MMNRYILLKIYLNEVRYKDYQTSDELKQGYEASEEFSGEVSAEYDLEAEKFIYMRNLHGEGSILEPTIQSLKAKYKKQ